MSSNCWEPEGSCYDVGTVDPGRCYGHLPTEMLEEWARKETMLSYQFKAGKLSGVSSNEAGQAEKARVMKEIDGMFAERASDEMKQKYEKELRAEFETRLEDPGLLHNFLYFKIPSSEFMLQFYLAVWSGRMARVMIYLHGYGWDLSEHYREIPASDVWNQMSGYEGMNINERLKVKELLCLVLKLNRELKAKAGVDSGDAPLLSVASFGGGNEPLRLYDPPVMDWAIFDNGDVAPMEELFPDVSKWGGKAMYYHEDLFAALRRPALFGTRDLVYMFGLSMYLGSENLPKALFVAFRLLKPGGYMMFDLLHDMDSIRRVVTTQGWPKGAGEMYIMRSADDAVIAARQAVNTINVNLGHSMEKGGFDIEKIQSNLVEPWGITSTVVTLRKYV